MSMNTKRSITQHYGSVFFFWFSSNHIVLRDSSQWHTHTHTPILHCCLSDRQLKTQPPDHFSWKKPSTLQRFHTPKVRMNFKVEKSISVTGWIPVWTSTVYSQTEEALAFCLSTHMSVNLKIVVWQNKDRWSTLLVVFNQSSPHCLPRQPPVNCLRAVGEIRFHTWVFFASWSSLSPKNENMWVEPQWAEV